MRNRLLSEGCGVNQAAYLVLGGVSVLVATRSRGWKRRLGFALTYQLFETAVTKRCLLNRLFGEDACPHTRESESTLVDEASMESFPASDAPAYAVQRA